MATFRLVGLTVLLALGAAALPTTTDEPCADGTCKNFTFFLGPRFGAKTIRLPFPDQKLKEIDNKSTDSNTKADPTDWAVAPLSQEDAKVGQLIDGDGKFVLPSIQQKKDMDKVNDSEIRGELFSYWEDVPKVSEFDESSSQDWFDDSSSFEDSEEISGQDDFETGIPSERPMFPRRRPVPEDESFRVDFMDVEQSRMEFDPDETTKTTLEPTHWLSLGEVNEMFESGSLNLTGFGLTGDQVKEALYNLSSDSRARLQSLSLSRNQIHSLPVLCFPVEMEYGLSELWLDNNPLGNLNSYTRFELSRLNSLKMLSLARTGLQYLESLYIPSLEYLDLSGNAISNYYYPMFDGFLNLEHLNLSHNSLRTIIPVSSASLSHLRVLDLSNNMLTSLYGLPVYKMYRLKELYLQNNAFKFSFEFEDVPYAVRLHLAGNPWECSCPLVQAVSKGWQDIADKEGMRCTDHNIQTPWPVMSLREEDVTVACPGRGLWGWLRGLVHELRGALNWLRMSPLLTAISWLLLACVLVVGVRTARRLWTTAPPATVPYNILDDKHPL